MLTHAYWVHSWYECNFSEYWFDNRTLVWPLLIFKVKVKWRSPTIMHIYQGPKGVKIKFSRPSSNNKVYRSKSWNFTLLSWWPWPFDPKIVRKCLVLSFHQVWHWYLPSLPGYCGNRYIIQALSQPTQVWPLPIVKVKVIWRSPTPVDMSQGPMGAHIKFGKPSSNNKVYRSKKQNLTFLTLWPWPLTFWPQK